MTIYADRIRRKLIEALAPSYLDIQDESDKHKGHAGHDERGETHFHVTIVSPVFQGLSRVQRHQKIYALLKSEMAERVHALSLQTRTPDEVA